MPNTKIVATLGPATDAPGVLAQLLAAGVDVFRLNASHGTRKSTPRGSRRSAPKPTRRRAHPGILLDLQGPKIRLGRFEDGGCALQTGATFTITTEPVTGNCERRLHRYTPTSPAT